MHYLNGRSVYIAEERRWNRYRRSSLTIITLETADRSLCRYHWLDLEFRDIGPALSSTVVRRSEVGELGERMGEKIGVNNVGIEKLEVRMR